MTAIPIPQKILCMKDILRRYSIMVAIRNIKITGVVIVPNNAINAPDFLRNLYPVKAEIFIAIIPGMV